ncbi:heme exporter protein CcmD [Sneathiella sp.]|jgi:heme exporter protein D|uniref:heme exporter protein CcmD n=1 Tax=Sneathiella sp. TaxID=1964365 RepID=UPI0039E5B65B
MEEFLNMGGYAAFIWPSYGISAAVLGLLAFQSVRRLRKVENELAPFDAERQKRRNKMVRNESIQS